MVKGFATQARSLHEDTQIGHNLLLPGEILKSQWAQSLLHIAVGDNGAVRLMYVEIVVIILHNAKLQKNHS